uniref:Uncharacterized protein n=1 Tax=Candidatus Kentrum sp. FW TaxID=2126338 RepID=A0A450RU58_9GAMM|nr:MAG: hypothetical protein BECKFW1821A_GA0114235_100211 [Candidatus Kentron sp. FW]
MSGNPGRCFLDTNIRLYAFRRLPEKNIPECAGFSSGFEARDKRIAGYVTVAQRGSRTIKASKLVYFLIEVALLQDKIRERPGKRNTSSRQRGRLCSARKSSTKCV